MSGDDVLSIMEKPDEVIPLGFVGDPVRGWIWVYNIEKKLPRAPDDVDRWVEIYFDINGKVKKISTLLQ